MSPPEAVGSATTAREIADELNRACESLRTVDYNALSPEELGETLDAFNTLQDLCHDYRRRQHWDRRHDETADE